MAYAISGGIPGRQSPGIGARLLGSLESHLGGSTDRGSRHGVLHIIACDRDRSSLLGPVPVRERTLLDVEDDGAVCLIDRVSAGVGDGALHRGLVLLRASGFAVVGRELENA